MTELTKKQTDREMKALDDVANKRKDLAEVEQEMLDKAGELTKKQTDRDMDEIDKATAARKKLAKETSDAQIKASEETARAFELMSNNIGNELSKALTKTQSFSDSFKNIMSNLIGQLIAAGITSGTGGEVGGSNLFAGLFSSAVGATAGGNAFGGGVSPIASHRVNERGDPELLEQAGKTYLTANGKGGKMTPLNKVKSAGGGQPNISIINMGTPINVESSNITEDGIELMINDKLAAFDNALTAEMSKTNTPKGRALKSAFRLENNLRR